MKRLALALFLFATGTALWGAAEIGSRLDPSHYLVGGHWYYGSKAWILFELRRARLRVAHLETLLNERP